MCCFKFKLLSQSVVGVMFLTSTAYAQNICDTVLLQRAFDTQNISTSSDMANQKRSEICSAEYDNIGQAQSRAGSAGFSLSYAGVGIGASGSRQKSNEKWDISQTDFCKSSHESIHSSYGSNFETVVARVAVSSWLECVKTTTQDGLFVSYNVSSDGTIVSGDMHFSISGGGPLERFITGMVLPKRERDLLTCSIGGEDVSPTTIPENGFPIRNTALAFVCEIDSLERNFDVKFQTSSGPSIALEFRTPETQYQMALGDLESRINELSTDLLPSGSVIAFSQELGDGKCPSGYDLLDNSAGRFLVGSVDSDDSTSEIDLGFLNFGGSSEILIESRNLPQHTHGFAQMGRIQTLHHDKPPGRGISSPGGDYNLGISERSRTTSANASQNDTITYIPPYLALNFCVKN